MLQNGKEANRLLEALGNQLAVAKGRPIDMLICGGAALNLLALVERTTYDIDVLTLIAETEGEITANTARPFPEHLQDAVARVAQDFDLPKDWLNAGPTSALDLGLPMGLLQRAEIKKYGAYLTVRLMSRYDQIHFKLYAAVDVGGKHYQDLLQLNATAPELEAAARWSMTHDVSAPFRDQLQKLLTNMGHADVAQRI